MTDDDIIYKIKQERAKSNNQNLDKDFYATLVILSEYNSAVR